MRVYLLSTDDNDGMTLDAFLTKSAQDTALLKWCKKHWDEDHGPMPDNAKDAHEIIFEYGDWVYASTEVVDLPEDPRLTEAKAQISALLEQISQMSGLFDDDDGVIAETVAGAEEFLNA